ncbi:HEAT repeat domain-containing protein [Acidobacteriota bacterium]
MSKQDRHLYRSALRKISAAKDRRKRLELIESMVPIKDSWASGVLLESLDDRNEEIRKLIIQELGIRDDLDLEIVTEKLSHPLWYVKSSALKILGLKRDKGVLIHIEALLTEPNVEVRRAIASALGDIGGKKSLSLLLKLSKDRNKFVRGSAEEAIAKVSNIRFT